MSDEDIADVLRVQPADVAERRRNAEDRLESELGATNGNGDAPAVEPRPRRRLAIGLLAFAAVAAVVLVVALAGGGKTHKSQTAKHAAAAHKAQPAPAEPKAKSPTTSAGPVRAMQVLNSTHGRGTAQLLRSGNGARLRLRLNDFLTPNGGGYAVWLFNSDTDARRLYATADTTIERDLSLPSDYGHFKYVDVARAVPSLNSPHGGLSLLRVSIASLR